MELKHTFPTYHKGQIPEVLHWWNPVHYWYLLVWIYFQPSKLRQYLWLADSELYKFMEWRNFGMTWQHPAYRNLWVMIPILTTTFTIAIAGIINQIHDVSWNAVLVGQTIGILLTLLLSGFGNFNLIVFAVPLGSICGATLGLVSNSTDNIFVQIVFFSFAVALGLNKFYIIEFLIQTFFLCLRGLELCHLQQ